VNTSDRLRLTGDLVRLADGDRSVFDAVFAQLWPVVRDFCARTLPGADAEDAAQAALEKVFARACSFDRTRDGLTWALAIASWEVRTLRTRARRSKTAPLEHEPLDDAGSPEDEAITRELEAAIVAVIGTLSERDRMTLHEAGSGPTFRKRKERAITRLRDAWRRLYGPT
jgi:RNA polymerase sigma factor (sigma-70 family)